MSWLPVFKIMSPFDNGAVMFPCLIYQCPHLPLHLISGHITIILSLTPPSLG